MKLFSLIATLVLPMIASAGDISRVSILDNEFREVKVISSRNGLSEFEEHWSKKSAHKPAAVEWHYKLDISNKSGRDRWLYHPDGWVQVLSVTSTPLYKISSPEQFNQLIGVHNKPLGPAR